MCKTRRSIEVFDLTTDAQDNKRCRMIDVHDLTSDVIDLTEENHETM